MTVLLEGRRLTRHDQRDIRPPSIACYMLPLTRSSMAWRTWSAVQPMPSSAGSTPDTPATQTGCIAATPRLRHRSLLTNVQPRSPTESPIALAMLHTRRTGHLLPSSFLYPLHPPPLASPTLRIRTPPIPRCALAFP